MSVVHANGRDEAHDDLADTRVVQREVDDSAPALMIKTVRQVGNQAMEMTFAVPLDMTLKDLNSYVDKATSVMDRQADKAALEQEEIALATAEKNLLTNREQMANAELAVVAEWQRANKKGTPQASGSHQKQIENFLTTSKHLGDVVIPKHRANIEALKRKINEGV